MTYANKDLMVQPSEPSGCTYRTVVTPFTSIRDRDIRASFELIDLIGDSGDLVTGYEHVIELEVIGQSPL